MTDPMRKTIRIFCFAFLFQCSAGCGLSDYEAKMAAEQARALRIEEENKFLDEPLGVPEKPEKDNDNRHADFFLRPPKGITRSVNKEPYGHLLYVYPSTGSGNFEQVYIGFGKKGGDLTKEVTKLFASMGQGKTAKHERHPDTPESLVYDTLTLEDTKSILAIHTFQRDDYQVAVVYRMDKSKSNADQMKAMDLSLDTMEVGAKSSTMRKEYSLRQKMKSGGSAK
jgi:hypothetical protein